MEIGSNFSSIFDFLVRILTWFINELDSITIGGVSLFVINLSLTVFLIVITATITVVRSGTVGTIGSVDRANAADKRAAERAAEKADRESYESYSYNRDRRAAYSKMYKDEHK